MNQKKAKWIKKVVISKHPKVMELVEKRVGKKNASKMTYNQVIKLCKKMWSEKVPGVEEWKNKGEAQ